VFRKEVFREKRSGVSTQEHRQLRKLIAQLESGDIVIVTPIDRLARIRFRPFAIVKEVVDAGCVFRSLAEPWADTGTSSGRLMLAVLGD
jgi:DNA invertase Pin-like site-specific DNA recombinase